MHHLSKLALVGVLAVALAASITPAESIAAPQAPTVNYFQIATPTPAQRQILARSGALVEPSVNGNTLVAATPVEAAMLRAAGLKLRPTANPVDAVNADIAAAEAAQGGATVQAGEKFPVGYEGYHTYDQTVAELRRIEAAYPNLAQVFDIGKSYEGRTIYGIKISKDVAQDRGKPESLQTCNVHAREHLTNEMCLYLANELTSKSVSDSRIANVLAKTTVWIIPMQNPDGAMYDIANGRFRSWRKNRQPVGSGYYGVDLNRNYNYAFGGPGSSSYRSSETYRGSAAEVGVEVKRLADFVRSRAGKIATHIDVHTYSELVLWPFGYTYDTVMPAEDYQLFETFGKKMAATNGYTPQKSSELYLASGTSSDWFYGSQKIWSYTFELMPKMGSSTGFYPKSSAIAKETARNREAFLQMWENTDCLWRVVGKEYKCNK